MFKGDRSTRNDPYRAIITVATREEGGVMFDILVILVQIFFFSFADSVDALRPMPTESEVQKLYFKYIA